MEKDKNCIISVICGIENKKQKNEQTKQNKLLDTDNRMKFATMDGGGRRMKRVREVKYMVMKED